MRKQKTKNGFSLVEIMVTLGITALMTVLFLANYHTSNQNTDLTMTAQEIVADLHAAQNNSLGLVKYNGVVPPGGWGINFDQGTGRYVVFADLNGPGTLGYMSYDTSTEGVTSYGARTVNISSGISILSLNMGGSIATTSVSSTNVTFLPPDPQTNIYSSGVTSTVLEIKLQEKANPLSVKTVRVNFLGLAEVTD